MTRVLRAPLLAASLALALPGCYLSGPHSRDAHRTLDQIRDQHRYAAAAAGNRTSAEQLTRIRDGDEQAAQAGRRRLRKLADVIERGTWIREATPKGLWASADDPSDVDELAFRWTRAARLRSDAILEADELAEALAESPSPGAIGLPEPSTIRSGAARNRNSPVENIHLRSTEANGSYEIPQTIASAESTKLVVMPPR